MSKHIAIIGGGIGGLSCAALLSAAGHRVTLLESNAWLGGKCRRLVHNGVTLDTGPAMFTFPKLWHSFVSQWQALSGKTVQALDLFRLPEVGRYLHENFTQDIPFAANDQGFACWQRYTKKNRPLNEPLLRLLQTDPRSSSAILPAIQMMRKLGGHMSMASWLRNAPITNKTLLDIITLQALNAGGSPDQVPALYASLLATLDQEGVYVPNGGMYTLILYLENLLALQGVEIKLNFSVKAITKQSVVGNCGQKSDFDIVVSSLDPTLTATLSGMDAPKTIHDPLSCSVYGLFGPVQPSISQRLPFQQVIMPQDLPLFFKQMDSAQLPQSTMVFVHNYPQGHVINPDPSQATMALLFTVPAKKFPDAEIQQFLQNQSRRLAKFIALPAAAEAANPLDALWTGPPAELGREYYGSFGHPEGALYGHLPKPSATGPFHPIPYQYPCRWLWQVGAGVHPGGGIPGTIGGSLIAAKKILRYLQGSKPTRVVEGRKMDRPTA